MVADRLLDPVAAGSVMMLLFLLVGFPFLAAGILALSGREGGAGRLAVVLAAGLVTLGLPLPFLDGVVATGVLPWFDLPGTDAVVDLGLRADGLSAWMVQMISLSTLVAVAIQAASEAARVRQLAVGAFLAAGCMLGLVLTSDLLIFYFCYEAMLAPVLVLIYLHGDSERRFAARRFFLYTLLFSVLLLVAIWYLVGLAGSTDIDRVLAAIPGLGDDERWWLAVAMIAAFFVKIPILPLHGWQADVYTSSSTPVTVLLAGAMGKMGLYGLMRLVLPGFDYELQQLQPLLLSLCGVTVVYGALLAVQQQDLKRLLAYASLSHLGLAAFGLVTTDSIAISGVLVQMVAHALSVGALLAVIAWLEDADGSRDLADLGGLADGAPLMAVLLLGAGLATIAMPGTAAFMGEFLLLLGAYHSGVVPLLALCLVGLSVIISAWYMLLVWRRVVFSSGELLDRRPVAPVAWTAAPLLLGSLVLGFWTTPITAAVADDSPSVPEVVPSAAQAIEQPMAGKGAS
jgi:NADH-quinone oxidoreductase subunit M